MTTTNTLKTVFLLTLMTGLLVLVGQLLGGSGGMVSALAFAVLLNVSSWWFSDRIALRMAGAQEADEARYPGLHRIVRQLAASARLPTPRVYVIADESPNAFATGRDPAHAAVVVTVGIMRLLTEAELAGVIAHELAHVKNRDTLIATVVATMAGAITLLAYLAQWALFFGGFGRRDGEGDGAGSLVGTLVAIFLAPIAATLVQLAISRARELQADATGARLLGNPLLLASALEKLERGVAVRPLDVNPAAAHLFIVNPFNTGGLVTLFMTHPPIAERVARLRAMALRPSAYGVGI